MRYPYERFLRFLVSRKVDVNQALRKIGLPEIGSLWFTDERVRIRRTAPRTVIHYLDSTMPMVAFKDGFLEWAAKSEILPFWQLQPEFIGTCPNEPAVDKAWKLFCHRDTRAVLGMALLAHLPETEVFTLLQDRCGVQIDAAILRFYSHLFWDISVMTTEHWNAFFPLLDRTERHYLATGLQEPGLYEIRYILGLEIDVEPDEVLQGVMNHAYMQFQQAMDSPNPEARNAFRWAELATNTAKQIRAAAVKLGAKPGETVSPAERFALFSVVPEKTKIPSLTELQGELSTPKADAK